MPTSEYTQLTPGERESPAKPRFYMDKLLSESQTAQSGHQVYLDVEMVEIIVPGDNKNVWAGKVKDEHRQRWPQHYEAFKKGLEPPQDGYPLKEWPSLTPAQVANFQALNIHTIEALAALPDNLLQHLGMGGFQIRDRANKWLAVQASDEALNKVIAERDAAEAETAHTKRRMEDLELRLAAMERAALARVQIDAEA